MTVNSGKSTENREKQIHDFENSYQTKQGNKKEKTKRKGKYVSLSGSSGQFNPVLTQMALVKLNGPRN